MAQSEIERQRQRDEQLATDFGRDPEGTRKSFERTRTVKVYQGRGQGQEQVGTREETYIRPKDRKRLEQAEFDFANRAGASGDVDAQNRGAAGGSFAASGDFGPGAIRLNTVTPVNSKVNGR